MRSVGIDLGKKLAVCEVAGGAVVYRTTVRSWEAVRGVLGADQAPARVAIEACREAWAIAERLSEWGHEVLLVDTTRSRQMGIGQHRRKNDRIDAETLARAVEAGRVPIAHMLSPNRQRLRLELAVRRSLVEERAKLVTDVRGLGRATGQQLPSCDVERFVGKLKGMALDVEFAELAAPLLAMLEHLEPQIVEVEKRLETECAKEPAHQLLKTAPGVGSVVAGAFISVIDKPTRFQHAHQVEAYLGLVPSENTSGKRRLGSITKQGNSYLRSVLVQGAWAILRQRGGTDPLKLWADAVKNRRGKRIAVVAVARRLAGILWAMWRDKTVYEPGRLGIRGAEELERHAQLLSVRAVALRRAAKKHFHSTTREMSA